MVLSKSYVSLSAGCALKALTVNRRTNERQPEYTNRWTDVISSRRGPGSGAGTLRVSFIARQQAYVWTIRQAAGQSVWKASDEQMWRGTPHRRSCQQQQQHCSVRPHRSRRATAINSTHRAAATRRTVPWSVYPISPWKWTEGSAVAEGPRDAPCHLKI